MRRATPAMPSSRRTDGQRVLTHHVGHVRVDDEDAEDAERLMWMDGQQKGWSGGRQQMEE